MAATTTASDAEVKKDVDAEKQTTPLTPSSTNPDISKLAKATPTRSSTLPTAVPTATGASTAAAAAGTPPLSSSPGSKSRFAAGEIAPIGTPMGNGTSNLGAKSMPGSRRTSTIVGGAAAAGSQPGSAGANGSATFGLENLKLGGAEQGKDEDLAAESAQNSVKFLQLNDDDGLILGRDAKGNKLSTASAALDLAPLAQTSSQRYNHQRPFDTGLKTSEWPQFSGIPKTADGTNPQTSATAPSSLDRDRARGQSLNVTVGGAPQPGSSNGTGSANGQSTPQPQLSPNISRRGSPAGAPAGLADSIASLPAMPSRSVPGTPGSGLGSSKLASGFSSLRTGAGAGAPPAGIAGGSALEGLSAAQRGYSNPDLAKAFSKPAAGFGPLGAGGPRPYGNADPLYSSMNLAGNGGGVSGGSLGGHHFQSGYGDSYAFDDDGFGSNALYSGGNGGGMKNKRAEMDREYNRFAGMRIEDLQGELLSLCKDQHGCRYLQKKLEEEVPEHRDMIFRETYGHFPELMTDPFGNYLCQKLLEYSTDEQRTAICDSVANELVAISLNMHGTRAVQKMIDFLSNTRQPTQIRSIIVALSLNVVSLIKDLNGNHVIQKCLNKLAPEDNQFIYNAVAANCVEVATHRHGCCVLQRCIDHAADSQRVQLVTEITYNALTLVQDPFGNYVVQYVLDLNDVRFSEALIRQFIGNVCALSVQKFSSNVIEKCIRVADPELRKILVGELLNRNRLEKLLRDSFANYVVQTALDYADPAQRNMLVECIRPILPMIRNTPYGKRIQSKLQREQIGGFQDHHSGGGGGGYGGHGQSQYMNLGSINSYGGGGRGGNYGGHHNHRGNFNNHHMGGGHHPAMHHHNPMNDIYGGQPQLGAYGGQFNNGMGGGFDMGFAGHGLPGQQFGGMAQQQGHMHQQSFGGQPAYGGAPGADAAVQFPPGAFSVIPPGQGNVGQVDGGNPGLVDASGQQPAYASYL